jgi:hypothetical protein
MKAAIEIDNQKYTYELEVIISAWDNSVNYSYLRGLLVGLRFHHNPFSDVYKEFSFLLELTRTKEDLDK